MQSRLVSQKHNPSSLNPEKASRTIVQSTCAADDSGKLM